MWSDAYTGAIAGAYLCLDSLSSVMLIAVYGAFDDENGEENVNKLLCSSGVYGAFDDENGRGIDVIELHNNVEVHNILTSKDIGH
jgi:hypothetical protein